MRPFHHITIVFFAVLGILVATYTLIGISPWWIITWCLAYIHLLVLGAIYIRWNFYVRSYDKGTHPQWIALSFDDGPAKETGAILDILKEQEVPAAFFCIGKNAAADKATVKRWHDEGHVIGNHSYGHGFNFDWQRTTVMADEITRTNRLIADITGKTPKLFRPPYGVTNPNLARAIKRTGMHSIAWSVRSFDTTAKDPQQLLDRILGKLQGGDIILLHDSITITREILTELIRQARQKGFTFVRVDQLLHIEAYE